MGRPFLDDNSAGGPALTREPRRVTFGDASVPDENNIEKIFFPHRGPTVYNPYGYDDIDRLTTAAYHNSDAEGFGMDDLGNRTGNQTLRGEGTVNFAVEPLTNRYTAVAGNPLAYDDAGNLTQDKDGYQFTYDCENRIIEVRNSSDALVAEFDYDTQGRRIRVYDAVSDSTTLYYYSDNWQVLSTYVGGSLDKSFVYGNYIDEVLLMIDGANDYFYLHDHLYSPAVLLSGAGSVVERYEYDAYGNVHIMDVAYNVRPSSNYGNPFYLTGRGLDVFDGGDYAAYDYRHRTYGPEMGRMYHHDPYGIVPDNAFTNPFRIDDQYADGLSLYVYVRNNPVAAVDPMGLYIPIFPISPSDIYKYLRQHLGSEISVVEPHDLLLSRCGRRLQKMSYGHSCGWNGAQAFAWWGVGGGKSLRFNHNSGLANAVAASPALSPQFLSVQTDLHKVAYTHARRLLNGGCTSFSVSNSIGIYSFYGTWLWPVFGRGEDNEYSHFSYRATCLIEKGCCEDGKAKFVWKCLTRFRLDDKFTFDDSPVLGWLPFKEGRNYWIHVRFYEEMNGSGTVKCD